MLLLDVTRLCGRLLEGRLPTGVDRVSLEYLRHFRHNAQALVRYRGRWIVLAPRASARLFATLLDPGADFRRVIRWCVGPGYVLNWGHAGAGCVLLNTGHSGLDHPAYALQVRRRGLRAVFFLHDLIPITHPEYSRPGEAEKHQRRVHTMLAAGSGVLVNSHATRTALECYAARCGEPRPLCTVAPLAPAALPAPAAERPIAAPYFVMLGTIEPRKNHLLLLHLWRQLAEEQGARAAHLVLIGQRGWECEQVVDLLERCPALRGLVIELPRCGDAALATWLHHAQALLFPSFVEGFGMPLIESLAAGLPVIASALPVFREVAGEIPEYLDPLDGSGWKARVQDYANVESAGRRAQLARLQGYQAPGWPQHFKLVEAMIERIAGST